MANNTNTASELLVRSGGENDFLAGLYFSGCFSHSILEEVESTKIIAMVREDLMLRDFRLVTFFGVLYPFRALDNVFKEFSSSEARSLDLFASSTECYWSVV